MIDWKKEIVTIALLQQEIERLDEEALWDRRLPNIAAPEPSIASARAKYGDRLSPGHLEFLRHADGWTNVLQYVDLFGTSDLLGSDRYERARAALEDIDDAVAASGIDPSEAVIVAASSADPDIYVSPLMGCRNEGAVYWFAGEEIQRFTDFEDFFLGLADYNRRLLTLTEQRRARSR